MSHATKTEEAGEVERSDVGKTASTVARIFLLFMIVLYIGSYLALSRAGFRFADRTNCEGFYFVEPHDEYDDRVNHICVIVYYPLIFIDNLIGTGRSPASAPTRSLSFARGPEDGAQMRQEDYQAKSGAMGVVRITHPTFLAANRSLADCGVSRLPGSAFAPDRRAIERRR